MKLSSVVRFSVVLAVAVAAVGSSAEGAIYTFAPTINTATPWSTTTAWGPNGTPGAGDTLLTTGGVSGTNILTVDGGSRTVLNVTSTLNTTAWAFTAGTAPTTLNITGNVLKTGSGVMTFLGNLDGTNQLTVNVGGNMTVSRSSINFGAGGQLVAGVTVSGTTILDAASFAPSVNLILANGGTANLGHILMTAGANTATVNIRNTTSSGTAPVVVNGISGGANGVIQNAGGGGGNTYGMLVIDSTGSAAYGGTIRNNSGSTTTNMLSVVKSGTGTQVFTNENSYTGGTTINAGTLVVNNTVGSGIGAGAVVVGTSGTLAGTGFVTLATNNSVTVNGTLAVGDGGVATTMDINTSGSGATAFGTNSHVVLDIFTNSISGVDKLVTTGAVSIASGATLRLLNTGGVVFAEGDQFDLFDWGTGPTGTFSYVLPSLGGDLIWDTSALYSTGVLSVVPEPGTWALLGVGLGAVLWRVRRRLRA